MSSRWATGAPGGLQNQPQSRPTTHLLFRIKGHFQGHEGSPSRATDTCQCLGMWAGLIKEKRKLEERAWRRFWNQEGLRSSSGADSSSPRVSFCIIKMRIKISLTSQVCGEDQTR